MKIQTSIYYPEVSMKALDVLTEAHYFPKVVGYGPLPSVPRYEKGWLIDPTNEIHPYAKRGVEALRASQIPITGFILAHELEFIVTEEPKPVILKSNNILPAVSAVAGIATILISGLIAALANVDPSFIAVLDDPEKTWLEIVNWRT